MSADRERELEPREDHGSDTEGRQAGQRGLGGDPVADAFLRLQRTHGNADVNRLLARSSFWDAWRAGSKKVEDTLSDFWLANVRETERARQVMEGATSSKDRHGASVTVPHMPPVRGTGPNPSYQKARDWIGTWFDDAVLATNLMLDAKAEGLEFFVDHTGADYNELGTTFMDVFLAVLQAVPLVGSAAGFLNTIVWSNRLAAALGRIDKVADAVDKHIGHTRATAEILEGLADGPVSRPEGPAKVEFKVDMTVALRHERERLLDNLQTLRDVVLQRLEGLEHSATLDLRAIAERYLNAAVGSVPKVNAVRRQTDSVSAGFELELYRRYYSRRAYWLHTGGRNGVPAEVELKGVPHRLPDRLRALCAQLGKSRDLRKALGDWKLPHRRLDRHLREVDYPAHERTLDSLEALPVYGDIVAGMRKAIEARF